MASVGRARPVGPWSTVEAVFLWGRPCVALRAYIPALVDQRSPVVSGDMQWTASILELEQSHAPCLAHAWVLAFCLFRSVACRLLAPCDLVRPSCMRPRENALDVGRLPEQHCLTVPFLSAFRGPPGDFILSCDFMCRVVRSSAGEPVKGGETGWGWNSANLGRTWRIGGFVQLVAYLTKFGDAILRLQTCSMPCSCSLPTRPFLDSCVAGRTRFGVGL